MKLFEFLKKKKINSPKDILLLTTLEIGSVGNGSNSTSNTKILTIDTFIQIPRDAFFAFDSKKFNHYKDSFKFEVLVLEDFQTIEVSCIRTDENHGWGQNLVVEVMVFCNKDSNKSLPPKFELAKKVIFPKKNQEKEENKTIYPKMTEKKQKVRIIDVSDLFHKKTLDFKNSWLNSKNLGIDKFEEYAAIPNKMMIRLEILQRSRMEIILQNIDSNLLNYDSIQAEKHIVKAFGQKTIELIHRLGGSFGKERWRDEYLLKSIYIQTSYGESSEECIQRAWNVINYIEENVDSCSARKMECWFVVVEGASFLISAQRENNEKKIEDSDVDKIKKFLINYLHELRQEAFNKIFLAPTREYYERTYQTVRSFDTYVHGYNVYACLVLATLGVQLDKPIVFDDEAKSIVEFLSVKNFSNEVVSHFWAKNKWMKCEKGNFLSRAMNDNFFIFPGSSPMQIALNSISDDSSKSDRIKMCQYLEHFTMEFSKEKLLLKLANKILDRNSLSWNVIRKFLAEKGKENIISNLNEFVWSMNEEDPTKFSLNEKNILGFLRFLEIAA